MGARGRPRKYNNCKVEADGHTFDSKHEYEVYLKLKAMEDNGLITNLALQVPYKLIEAQKLPHPYIVKGKSGKATLRRSMGAIKYIADFVYRDKDGETRVVDAKGFRTDVYNIKKRLMLERYGIQIEEV